MFPFIYNEIEYTKCTGVEGQEWCATMVDEGGVMVEGFWEYCGAGC